MQANVVGGAYNQGLVFLCVFGVRVCVCVCACVCGRCVSVCVCLCLCACSYAPEVCVGCVWDLCGVN